MVSDVAVGSIEVIEEHFGTPSSETRSVGLPNSLSRVSWSRAYLTDLPGAPSVLLEPSVTRSSHLAPNRLCSSKTDDQLNGKNYLIPRSRSNAKAETGTVARLRYLLSDKLESA